MTMGLGLAGRAASATTSRPGPHPGGVLIHHSPPTPEVLTDLFNQRISAWRQHLRASYAETTIRARAGAVEHLVKLFDIPGGEATEAHVREFFNNGDYMPWTQLTYLRHFRMWGDFIAIPDPTANIPRPKSPRFELRPVDEHHLDDLLANADGDRMRAWIVAGAELGLFPHETAELTGSQFTLSDGRLVLTIGEFQLPVSSRALEVLAPLLHHDGRLWPVTPLYISTQFHGYAASRGYDYAYVQLRHRLGKATYLRTGDLIKTQYMLRHVKPKTTAQMVADLTG